jgi:hypothetical protein
VGSAAETPHHLEYKDAAGCQEPMSMRVESKGRRGAGLWRGLRSVLDKGGDARLQNCGLWRFRSRARCGRLQSPPSPDGDRQNSRDHMMFACRPEPAIFPLPQQVPIF